ncbi:hypothetical protein ASPTUDRAFT_30550 [Aspergillus tubingensis CBS 134.48]|uniref:ABC-2 type transporter transmembrane domain-containing protein n=1 Tax=Aspergillus tubingensis (strain CBS 134.48) TaxID=767770 RepID=A0A1L9MZK3_ASPTC|nr:hypothetical protein ASPTUDRAFT_30550 [Aspergillus tubingensis CBS 134.48]
MSFMAVACVPAFLEDRVNFAKERANACCFSSLLFVFITSIFPNFVIALALVAFANGLWMSVGGFLVTPKILNPFWKYVFHYIDYQSYVFQGMMVNEFSHRNYSCGKQGQCTYVTDLADQCMIRGTGVLEEYGYATGRTGKWSSAPSRREGWCRLSLVSRHIASICFTALFIVIYTDN